MKTVIEMAREAGGIRRYFGEGRAGLAFHTIQELERFAALVREDENKSCEMLCTQLNSDESASGSDCAYAIRMRRLNIQARNEK